MLRSIIVYILLLTGLQPVFPQSAKYLGGRILDQNGGAVSGSRVHLYEGKRRRASTIADQNGIYRFDDINAGEYLLSVESTGFRSETRRVYVDQLQIRPVDIKLQVEGLNTEVVVTASDRAESIDEVSKSFNLITSDEIESRNEYKLTEIVRVSPGVRVQQLGGPGSLANIRIRGLRTQDTSVLIDGFRFRDASNITADASSFVSDMIVVGEERAEILRGSGSSLYGTNSIGGVINLITDEVGGPIHGHLHVEGGSLGLFRGRAKVAGGALNNRFNYSAGLAHLNVSQGLDRNDRALNTSGQGFAQYSTSEYSISGRVYTGRTYSQVNDSPASIPAAQIPQSGSIRATLGQTFNAAMDDPDFRRNGRYFSGALSFNHTLNEWLNYQVSYHRVNTNLQFRDGPGGRGFEPFYPSLTDNEGRIDTLIARSDIRTGRRNLLTIGYELERESYDTLSLNDNPNPATRAWSTLDVNQRSHTFYLHDQLRLLNDRLQLSASGRVQSFNLSNPRFAGGRSTYSGMTFQSPPTAFTGDAAISYFFPQTGTKIRGHVGNAYRAPSPYNRFGSAFFSGRFHSYGDPRLRPERSISFDAGLDQSLIRGRVKLSGTYFYTRLQEVISFDSSGVINTATDPFGRSMGYLNTPGGLARGVELSATLAPTLSTEIMASYTYTNSDERVSTVETRDIFKAYGVSDHMFTLHARQRIGRNLDLSFDLFAASNYLFPFFVLTGSRAYEFEGPIRADLVARYTIPMGDENRFLRITGKVENLFDRDNYENGFRNPGRGAIAGISYHF
jgi:vitamin B12 transporter